MIEAVHKAGHKSLKLLFVLALAGSSALFFIGSAVPKPPALVVIIIGGVLGVALEWAYFTVSCDLTDAITKGDRGAIFLNLLYTLAGGVASWFLFTNAALHVGWAPTDDLIGLSRVHWAMILAALIVVVIFVLSARRKPAQSEMDMSAIARSIEIHMPNAPQSVRMRILKAMLDEAEQAAIENTRPIVEARAIRAAPARMLEAAPPEVLPGEQEQKRRLNPPASGPAQPGWLKRGWQKLWGNGDQEPEAASEEGEEEESKVEEAGEQQVDVPAPAPRNTEPVLPDLPDRLQLAIEALTEDPEITDEELAEELGLKKAASARYWRLKALELLTSHQLAPMPARSNEEQRPRSRQDTLADLIGFAEALKADTGLDLMVLVRQALGGKSKEPPASEQPATSEQVDAAPLAAPVEETGAESVTEHSLPFPAVLGAPGLNHGNHRETDGVYERWGGEGEGRDDDTTFRERTN